jgi:hypothetical protein
VYTMFYAVSKDDFFYVETALGIMTIGDMFQASCFETVEELMDWIESFDIEDYDIYEITKY